MAKDSKLAEIMRSHHNVMLKTPDRHSENLYQTGGPVTTWKIQVLQVLQKFYRT